MKFLLIILFLFTFLDVKADEIEDLFLKDNPTNILFWNKKQKIYGFKNIEKLLPVKVITKGSNASPLPERLLSFDDFTYSVGYKSYDIDDYFKKFNIGGMIILHEGNIVFEKYALGNTIESKWISFSVTKSVTSMLLGAAIKDGYIKSVNEPVTKYIPQLKDSAYERAQIKDILHMSSGVAWNEDYEDPASDVSIAAAFNSSTLYDYLSKLPVVSKPGVKFNYNTGETNLLGGIVRSAVGIDLSSYLEKKIWQPYGMTRNAFWPTDINHAEELGGCCITATLRDYAKIGLFASQNGKLVDGTQVLPKKWMEKSTTASKDNIYYGYQWWLDGPNFVSYAALGVFGQMIWIDPQSEIVIAIHSSWDTAEPDRNTALHRTQLIISIYNKLVK